MRGATTKTIAGYAPINGGRLYYEVAGSGTPVVLVHGFTLDTRMWDAQFEAFAARHTVIRYDVRGFGKSSLPEKPYSNAEDLNGLLDHLHVDKAAVIGLSMGGGIITEFVLRHPGRVTAFVPVDAGGSTLVKKDDPAGQAQLREFNGLLKALPETAKREGVKAAIRLWLDCILFAPERELPRVKQDLELIVSGYSGWHWLNPPLALSFKPEPPELYGRIRAPTLVVLGERDLPFFHSIAHGMVSGIPGARLHVIPRAGHMANMDAPAEFNRAVLDFLAAV